VRLKKVNRQYKQYHISRHIMPYDNRNHRTIIRNHIELLFLLIQSDRCAELLGISVNFQNFKLNYSKVNFIIRELLDLSANKWHRFLKKLRNDTYIEHRELGRVLTYYWNNPYTRYSMG
jgi:hypothetical protein